MSEYASRPFNNIARYYDWLAHEAAEHIDAHPELQSTDNDKQRSIFVAECQAIAQDMVEFDFATFRARLLRAYHHSGLTQRFPSRQLADPKKNPALPP